MNGWKGHYGKHGAVKEIVLAVLKAHEGDWLATDNIELLVCLELHIAFESPAERKCWYDYAAEGLIERQHDPEEFISEVAYWRWWEPDRPSLAL